MYFKPSINGHTAKTTSLKEGIGALLKKYQLERKYREMNIVSGWEQIMGTAIANRTTNIYIANETLFLSISSAPLKNQLLLGKTRLIALVNQHAGQDVVKDVIIR